MDARAVDALFNGSVVALIATATTVVLDLFGFVNVAVPAAFVLGSAASFAFAAAAAPEWQWIAAGALVGLIAGFAIDRLALDPLRRRGRNSAMLPASIGASLIAYGLSRIAFAPGIAALPRAVSLTRVATIGSFTITELQAFAIFLTICACALLDIAVRKTRFGNGVRAACENPRAAQLMGMRIDRVPAAAMAVTCAMASAAGALYTVHGGSMSAGLPPMLLLYVLAVVALVPAGSIWGACLVSFALVIAGAALGARLPWLPVYASPLALLGLIAAGLAWTHARAADAPPIAET